MKKCLVMILAVLAINLSLNISAFAEVKENKETKIARKLKREITKLGTGTDARIEVKLKDGTKLKGYVSEIADDHFTVADEKSNTATTVPYANAKQVKGNNLSTGAKILIVVGIVAAIFVISYIAAVFFAE